MILRPALSDGLPFSGFYSKKKGRIRIDWKIPTIYANSALSSLL
jgi:hypothetical protein